MMQIIEQTRDEKIAMYMKLSKRELAEILTNSNEALNVLLKNQQPIYNPQPYTYDPLRVGDFTAPHLPWTIVTTTHASI